MVKSFNKPAFALFVQKVAKAAAGWSSGAMVARYTRALSGELAITEFQRSWL
jgi:hypothetical protein